jgi:hypothetical protein
MAYQIGFALCLLRPLYQVSCPNHHSCLREFVEEISETTNQTSHVPSTYPSKIHDSAYMPPFTSETRAGPKNKLVRSSVMRISAISVTNCAIRQPDSTLTCPHRCQYRFQLSVFLPHQLVNPSSRLCTASFVLDAISVCQQNFGFSLAIPHFSASSSPRSPNDHGTARLRSQPSLVPICRSGAPLADRPMSFSALNEMSTLS